MSTPAPGRRSRLPLLCLAALLLAPPGAAAQAEPSARTDGSTEADGSAEADGSTRTGGHVPQEYEDEEFSAGLRALRRGEIIMLGSLPFTLFFTLEAYDIGRYFAHDRRPEYSPWPLRRPGAAPYTTAESLGVLATALGVSLAIAVADYLIGKAHERRDSRRPAED